MNFDSLKKNLNKKQVDFKRPAALGGKFARLRVSNKLWPIAAVLGLALVVVPMMLSSSGSPSTPIAQIPPSPAIPSVSGIPAVSVDDTAVSHAKLNGPSHNPFKQLKGGGGSSSSSGSGSTKTEPTPSQTSSGSSSKSGSTSPSNGNGNGNGNGTTTTTTTTPPPPPPPSGLTPTQTYDVALSVTNNKGNENTINSLERLSALPSNGNPLLVELGVLKGGKRVLFAVQPGTVVRGGGQCIPGPVDCEILSLARGQIEKLEAQTQDGIEPQALFAVTAITMQGHGTAANADAARRVESSYGHKLLRQSPGTALSLFPYEASLGAIVDQRNLGVGGGGN